jgi:hypothetical protein
MYNSCAHISWKHHEQRWSGLFSLGTGIGTSTLGDSVIFTFYLSKVQEQKKELRLHVERK